MADRTHQRPKEGPEGPEAPTLQSLEHISQGGATCAACRRQTAEAVCAFCGAVSEAGEFRVLRVLAESERGRVYLAEGPGGTRVALKEVVFATVPSVEVLEAFEREAEVLNQLDHPRIPRFVASFRTGEGARTRLYLAQRYEEGPTLLEELKTHRFSEEEVEDVARRVLPTVGYLHGRSPRLVHRDIKPANLIRTPDGAISLVDFGSVRELPRGLTHRSTLAGTFGYMPPEQLGGTVDPTADLYALGATLLHLLSRRPPDEMVGPGMTLDVDRHLALSPRMAGFLRRLLAPSAPERFQTAAEALTYLDAATGASRAVEAVAPALAAQEHGLRCAADEQHGSPDWEGSAPFHRWMALGVGVPLAALQVALIDGHLGWSEIAGAIIGGGLGLGAVWYGAQHFRRWVRRLAYSVFGSAYLLNPLIDYLHHLQTRSELARFGFELNYQVEPSRFVLALMLGGPMVWAAIQAWREPAVAQATATARVPLSLD